MKQSTAAVCLGFLSVFALSAGAYERMPYDRYRTIVKRQMFGALPADYDPTKSPDRVVKIRRPDAELGKREEEILRHVQFSVLNVTVGGETEVGFSDIADPKHPVNYYLKVGETRNGWTVKTADRAKGSMTVEKDGVEVTLRLGMSTERR